MNNLILITGGARSGKSTFAESLAEELYNNFTQKQKIAYIATGVPFDNEFNERIIKHRERRKAIFTTYEEDLAIDEMFSEIYNGHKIFIVECLATWLGNIFHKYNQDEVINKSNGIINNILNEFCDPQDLNKSNEEFIEILEDVEKRVFNKGIKSLFNKNESDKILIIVTNETGLSIVPDNTVARSFRDILGNLNQIVAKSANFVYLLISGSPIRIK